MPKRKPDTKIKVEIRDKLFDFYNSRRERLGYPRLEKLNDGQEMQELSAGFDFIYDKLSKGKKKAEIFKEESKEIVEEVKELPTRRSKRREEKEQYKRSLHTSTCTTKDTVDFESELFKINIQKDSDPQGYALLFERHIKSHSCTLTKSSAAKYYRSFKSFVDQ